MIIRKSPKTQLVIYISIIARLPWYNICKLNILLYWLVVSKW